MPDNPTGNPSGKKKFIGIQFLGCNTYGRLYPNKENTHFVGRCPRCGLTLKLKIGAGGTSEKFFKSTCLMTRAGRAIPRNY